MGQVPHPQLAPLAPVSEEELGSADDPSQGEWNLLTDTVGRRGNILVTYRPGFRVFITTFGILAVVITGLFGYPRGDGAIFPGVMSLPAAVLYVLDVVFAKPWLLYLFFCTLILTVQWSILRRPQLTRPRRVTLTVTLVSMIIVAVLYLYRNEVLRLLGDLLSQSGRLRALLQNSITNPWTYLLLDALLLTLLFAHAAWGWFHLGPGQILNPPIDLSTRTAKSVTPTAKELDVQLADLIAGDLIVRGVLAGILGLFFWYPILSSLLLVLGQQRLVQPGSASPRAFSFCTVSLPGTCTVGFSWEIWSINVLVMIFAAAVGLLLLGFIIQKEALANARQTDRRLQDPLSIARETLSAFYDILRGAFGAFNRAPQSDVGQRIGRNLHGPLRPLAWPLLVFLGVVGAAGLADSIQRSFQSPKFWECSHALAAQCQAQPLGQLIVSQVLETGLPTLVFVCLSVLGPTVALAVMFADWGAATNTFRFLWLLTLLNAFTLASIGVALFLFNFGALILAHLINLSTHQDAPLLWKSWFGGDSPTRLHPFYPGLFSLLFFALLAGYFLVAQLRPHQSPVMGN